MYQLFTSSHEMKMACRCSKRSQGLKLTASSNWKLAAQQTLCTPPDDCLALFGMSEEEDTLKFMVMSLCTTGQAQGKTKAQCSERFEQYCSESAIATSSNSDVQEQLCSAMEEQIVDATIGGTEASLHDQRLQE